MSHRRRALTVLLAASALGLLDTTPAMASSGVVIHRIPDSAVPNSGPNPDVAPVFPWVTKHGNVVLDAKVITVRQGDTVIAAGRTSVSLAKGVYRVTTTARYRTFSTVGRVTRTLAHTGDAIAGFSRTTTVNLSVQGCPVTDVDLGAPPDDSATPQSGTFTAKCPVSWDNGSLENGAARVATGSTAVTGTIEGVLKSGDSLKTWTFTWDGGVSAQQTPVGGLLHADITVEDGMSVVASQPVRHVFPVRKYFASRTKRLTQTLTVR